MKEIPFSIKYLDKQNDNKEYRTSLYRKGYYTTAMILGAANVLRALYGRKPYSGLDSILSSIKVSGFKPVARTGQLSWWNPDEVVWHLAKIPLKSGRRVGKDTLYLPATEEHLANGEWVDINLCKRLTGMSAERISSFGWKHPEHVRIHPNGMRLYHLRTLTEWGDYRPIKYLRKVFGQEAVEQLLKTRHVKTYDVASDWQGRLIYCPELRCL